MKPLLFLDIDGVLNSKYPDATHSEHHVITMPAEKLTPTPFTIHTTPGTNVTLKVNLDPRYREWLAELSEYFELAWASTWEHAANEYLSPLLGLGDLIVVEHSKEKLEGLIPESLLAHAAEWKWTTIVEVAGTRPFALVDDTAIRIKSSENIMKELRGDIPTLIIVPEFYLTREHVDELIAFAKAI
jgi:hypothetical protein